MTRTAYISQLSGISKVLVERLQTLRVFGLNDTAEVAAAKLVAHRAQTAAAKEQAAAAKLAHQRRLVADCKRQGMTIKDATKFLTRRKLGLGSEGVSEIWKQLP